ncbi:hypothetical protein V6X63_10265 [Spiribacter sp. 221]
MGDFLDLVDSEQRVGAEESRMLPLLAEALGIACKQVIGTGVVCRCRPLLDKLLDALGFAHLTGPDDQLN